MKEFLQPDRENFEEAKDTKLGLTLRLITRMEEANNREDDDKLKELIIEAKEFLPKIIDKNAKGFLEDLVRDYEFFLANR